jgi:ornithine decarboxylase
LHDLFADPSTPSPVMLLSVGQVGANVRALQAALPRVQLHYAVKPNNHPAILDEVFRLGGNFDICSAGEFGVVKRTNLDLATLIHSHPVKSVAEFDQAVAAGVEIFVVDNMSEVAKLSRYTDKRLKILVRFRIHSNTKAVVNLQYKFGCPPEQVVPLAAAIEETGHDFYGLCFHVGSQCLCSDHHVMAIRTAHELVKVLDTASFDTRMLDIGGGYPVEYIESVPDIDTFCSPIRDALDRHVRPGIKVVCEPGRFIAANPVTLMATILGKAERDGKIWYYLDDGLYSTFSGIVYDHCQYPVVTLREGPARLSVLAGPTCDSFDVMYDGLMLPDHEVGDRVMFLATGAYCAVSGSGFNGLRRPNYMVVE